MDTLSTLSLQVGANLNKFFLAGNSKVNFTLKNIFYEYLIVKFYKNQERMGYCEY